MGKNPRVELRDPSQAAKYLDMGVQHFCIGWDVRILADWWDTKGAEMRGLVDGKAEAGRPPSRPRSRQLLLSQPPVAPRRPAPFTRHGITVADDYAWLKDPDWQKVLRDPSLLQPDIRAYLEAENRYTEAFLGADARAAEAARRRDARPHQGGRFRRADAGRAVRLHLEVPRRRPARADRPHCRATAASSRPSSTAMRWPRPRTTSSSAAGGIRPTIGSKPGAPTCAARSTSRSASGAGTAARICPTRMSQTGGSVVWGRDSTFFFYVLLDDNHRPLKVFRHRLGTPQSDDVLVYEEPDAGWFTHIEESASGRFCIISGGDHDTSEQRLVDLSRCPTRRRA